MDDVWWWQDYKQFCNDSADGAGPWSDTRSFDLTQCFEDTFVLGVPRVLFTTAFALWLLIKVLKRKTTDSIDNIHSSSSSVISAINNSSNNKALLALAAAVVSLWPLFLIRSHKHDGSNNSDNSTSSNFGYDYDASATTRHAVLAAFTAAVSFSAAAALHKLHAITVPMTGSTALLLFWLASLVVAGIQLRTDILIAPTFSIQAAIHLLQILLILPAFVLENMPRRHFSAHTSHNDYTRIPASDLESSAITATAIETDDSGEEDESENLESPELYANIFSVLTFHWMDGLMKLGYSKDLEMQDLWALRAVDSANANSRRFLWFWGVQLKKKRPSLLWALVQSYGLVFASAAIFKASQDVLSFIQPTFLRYIMEFTNSWSPENRGHEQPLSRGFCIAILMLSAAITQTFLLHQYFHTCIVIGMRVKAAVITAIYQKSLRLSPAARQSSTVGEIVNLMSVDAGRLGDLTTYFHIVWSGPFQITLALYFLYHTLGVAIFAGVGVMILMIPVNGVLATMSRRLNKIQMGNKDRRTKLMDEILNGIKVIKLYAWEMPFRARIDAVRELELRTLMRIGYLSAASSFTWVCTPLMVSFVSFALYSAISNEPLTSTKVFVSISLFNLLQFPLAMFPSVITAIIDASVSFNRLYTFLRNEEIDLDAVTYEDPLLFKDQEATSPIERLSIKDGSFRWVKESAAATISNIDLKASDGMLVAVVGVVGSGKSSLLGAMLGEMYKSTGSVIVRGTVAYVPQTAWIMNATLKENILFGHSYDPEFYDATIAACGLGPDLEILPGGDLCEIGERGINLSGGQKQRINLARAVYARADIYLLDDTLSAVDAHVGRHIFDNVIGPHGLLRTKARVFVTHSIHVIHEADYCVLMQNGEIAESGKYASLMTKGKKFCALMKEYGKRKEESDDALTLSVAASPAFGAVKPIQAVVNLVSAPTDGKKVVSPVRTTALTVKEESMKGSVSWAVYAAYASSCGIPSIVMFLCNAFFSQFLSIAQNLYLADWAESNDRKRDLVLRGLVSAENVEPENVSRRLLVYGGIGLLYAASFVLQTIFVWIFCGVRSARVLHQSMLENILRLPQSYFDTTPLGRIINRFSKDVYTVDEVLPRVFQGYTRTLFSVLAVLVINTLGNWMFCLFVLPMGVLYIYFQRYYLSTSRELKRLDSTSRSPIYAHFQETLAGVSTIRAYQQCSRFIDTNEHRVDYNMRAYYPSVSSNRWLAVRLEFIGSLIVFGSAMFAVVSIAVQGYVSASLVGLALTYSLNVTQSLNWLVRQSCEIETNIVSVERMKEYIEIPQEAPYEIEETKPPASWPEKGVVEFSSYSARYRQGLDLVLKELAFKVNCNEKIGIVGRTGAGKSSLTLALFRIMEPASGTIILDGVDISKIGLYDLRSKLTIIPQDPFVFNGTVRENLDPFNTASDTELWSALEAANMKNVIAEMDGKLDAALLQGGENLSCGQRQLLCLARAVLRKSKVMVLDEATASIDYETDNIIQKTIRSLAKHSTVITIAHRINTIIDYDRILVLDQGRVVELDSPSNLLKNRKSKFFGLAKEAAFWLKLETFSAQPAVTFMRESMIILDGTDIAIGAPYTLFYSTNVQLNQLFEFNVHGVPSIKTADVDINNDGIPDHLIFQIVIPLQQSININRVRLALFLRYDLDSKARLSMETAAIFDENIAISASSIEINADLRIVQRELLFPPIDNYDYMNAIIDYSLANTGQDTVNLSWPKIVSNYETRGIRTKLDFASGPTWSGPRAINQPLTIKGKIMYSKDIYSYRPGVMEVLKFAWIQYVAYFVLVYTVCRHVFVWAVESGVVNSHVIVDVLPKQDGFRGHHF